MKSKKAPVSEMLPRPPVASAQEWRKARLALLAREKELTRQYDRVSAARRRLPMVRIEKDYVFAGPEGDVALADLFAGRPQLIVYHFMFDPTSRRGCAGCTGWVDALGNISMLNQRRTSFALISRAKIAKLEAYRKAHGWSHTWVSSYGSDFNYDFHVTLDVKKGSTEYNFEDRAKHLEKGEDYFTEGEAHGFSVFFKRGEEIYHTYSCYARGCERLSDGYALLDMTPYGRQEDWEDSPPGWPQKATYGG